MEQKELTQTTNSFFAQFPISRIFELWYESNTLLEVAQKLGLKESENLSRIDYEYIESIKNRNNWRAFVASAPKGVERQKDRIEYIKQLSPLELTETMDLSGIETLSHLAVHYLVSAKHGRPYMRERILELELPVKDPLHKGVHGVSNKPIFWPTKSFEKRVGKKLMECPECGFQASKPQQIELHHPVNITPGPKNSRTVEYYNTQNIEPKCTNCHSLEHRTGEILQNNCGKWHIKLPGNQKHKNPDDIFFNNCTDTFRVQKNYYLKWHLTSPNQYKCFKCGVSTWGKENNLLSLEFHHKDGKHSNSLISNLELLCPNCHRGESN
jgi:hypothetical protein